MGQVSAKFSALTLNVTLGATNLLRSATEMAVQGPADLSNPTPHQTSALAMASYLCYNSGGTELPGYQLERVLEFRKGHLDLHAWFFVRHGTLDAILAIRGTQSMGNMLSNVRVAHVTIEDEVIPVLQEFVDACQAGAVSSIAASPDLRLALVRKSQDKNNAHRDLELEPYDITVTGHSLGGYWGSAYALQARLNCVTFCSPRNMTGLNFHAVGDWVMNSDPVGTYCQRHDTVLPIFSHGVTEVATYVVEREKYFSFSFLFFAFFFSLLFFFSFFFWPFSSLSFLFFLFYEKV